MSDSIIAIADTVFPSLDPAKKALSGQTSEDFRMSNDSSAESILAVAGDADASASPATARMLSADESFDIRKSSEV